MDCVCENDFLLGYNVNSLEWKNFRRGQPYSTLAYDVLKWERYRLCTFIMQQAVFNINARLPANTWPRQWRAMARNGLIYVGERNMFICVFCLEKFGGVTFPEHQELLETWHKAWKPDCPYLQGIAVGNVALGSEQYATQLDHARNYPVADQWKFLPVGWKDFGPPQEWPSDDIQYDMIDSI